MTEDTETVIEGELPALPADREWRRPWQSPFLRALSVLPDVTSACRVARIARRAAYDMRDRDPEFAEAWDEALQLASDALDRHLHRWVFEGVPVRSTRKVTKRKLHPDGTVLEITEEEFESQSAERSATLAIFYAKAWRPDRYRWSERTEVTGVDGAPIRVDSVEEIDRRIAALAEELAQQAGDEPVPVE